MKLNFTQKESIKAAMLFNQGVALDEIIRRFPGRTKRDLRRALTRMGYSTKGLDNDTSTASTI